MQLRPLRQQLLQHHATTKKSPPLALPLRPFRTYGPALQKTTTQTERRRQQTQEQKLKERKPTALLLLDQPHNSKISSAKPKGPEKPPCLPPPPKFIKITEIAVRYLEEIVRWSSRRRSYGDVCNERERTWDKRVRRRRRRLRRGAACGCCNPRTPNYEALKNKETNPTKPKKPTSPLPHPRPKTEKKTHTFPSPTHPRQTRTEKT